MVVPHGLRLAVLHVLKDSNRLYISASARGRKVSAGGAGLSMLLLLPLICVGAFPLAFTETSSFAEAAKTCRRNLNDANIELGYEKPDLLLIHPWDFASLCVSCGMCAVYLFYSPHNPPSPSISEMELDKKCKSFRPFFYFSCCSLWDSPLRSVLRFFSWLLTVGTFALLKLTASIIAAFLNVGTYCASSQTAHDIAHILFFLFVYICTAGQYVLIFCVWPCSFLAKLCFFEHGCC